MRKYLEKIYHAVVKIIFSILGCFPKKNLLFFESFHGKQYSDNPRAIYEYIQENSSQYQCIWAVKKGYEDYFIQNNIPYVRRLSFKWVLTMPRAEYWFFNTRMPSWMRKGRHTTYVQTWHGIPLKKLGLDIEDVKMPGADTKKYRQAFLKESKRWDYLISPNSYTTEIFRQAFGYAGAVLEKGYPRNDILIKEKENIFLKEELKKKLEIPINHQVLLYAPTWRDNEFIEKGKYTLNNRFPFEKVLKANPETTILTRMHYLVSESMDFGIYGSRVKNVSDYPDIRELYLITDVLITDYSSVMFDFALLKRPIFLYMYDHENYRENLRGFYFSPEKFISKNIVYKESALLKVLLNKRNKEFILKDSFFFMPRKTAISTKEILNAIGILTN